MLKNILNLEGVSVLDIKQQKSVTGGKMALPNGTCAYQSSHGFVIIDASMSSAQSGAAQSGGHWCCDSCCSASWAQGYGC